VPVRAARARLFAPRGEARGAVSLSVMGPFFFPVVLEKEEREDARTEKKKG
jgi:hypothetical protein